MTSSRRLDLAVHEGPDRPTGSTVARLPGSARRALGVLSGDTIVLEGDTPVVATVRPADAAVPDDGIALDRRVRRRLGVDPGEVVTARRTPIEDADEVVVAVPAATTESRVRRALEDRPLSPGDEFGLGDGVLRLLDTRPTAPVRLTESTTVHLRQPSPEEVAPDTAGTPDVGYDAIGGLDDELALVRETVELPLAEPELFDRLGIDPPTGVLLYGPPGTGKTLIAEAVASSVEAAFFHVSGPELTSKYKGESEERLRAVFERARERAPAVIFFDEIDAIAGKRDDGGDMEHRVVAQLLSLMDGLGARGGVVVVGATNRVDDLDPALRRPGRFDREIEIGVPDEAGRRSILAIHTEGVPLADDVDLDRLAAQTHGFVGADLRALITEAAMVAIRPARRGGDPDRVVVTRDDVETALAAVDPSAMREFVAEVPSTSFDDIGGLDEAKAALREAIEWPLAYPAVFDAAGTEAPTGVLLYGPPGTGKTLLARAVANESGVNFVGVAGPELIDKYVGESERAVREVFERARQAAPAVVFFDEIDALAGRRGGTDSAGVTERVVSQLLTELDGLAANPQLVVLAATNRREALDPALLRPGRLERHIEVPVPDRAARRAIVRVHTRETPLADDVELDRIVDELEGATGADIAALVREASMLAIREHVERVGAGEAERLADELRVAARHFAAASPGTHGDGG